MEPHHSYPTHLDLLLICMAIPVIAQTTAASTTPTDTSTTPKSTVTLVAGDAEWDLLGCYNELASYSSGRALGLTGLYISPILSSPDALTVPLCLEGCRVALAPNGAGAYQYAAVENIRECYCGLTLSSLSTYHDTAFCSSPCAADPATSCGGHGYLTLYERRSSVNTAFSTISPSSSSGVPTPTSTSNSASSTSSTSVPTKKALPVILIWIGIGLGLALLALLVTLLLYLEKRLYSLRLRHRTAAKAKAELTPSIKENPTSTPSFIGGYKLSQPNFSHPNPVIMGRTRSGHSVPKGRRFGALGDSEMAFTPLPPLVPPPPMQFEFQTEAAGKRHRDTFDAWKKGVVPAVKFENPVVKVDSDAGGTSRGKNAKELTLRELGMSYIGSREEKALPKTPRTPKTPKAELSGMDDMANPDGESGDESVDGKDMVDGDESGKRPIVGVPREADEDEGDISALEESGSPDEETEESWRRRI